MLSSGALASITVDLQTELRYLIEMQFMDALVFEYVVNPSLFSAVTFGVV